MRRLRGTRLQRQDLLLKKAYQQQTFETMSDQQLKTELKHLRKCLLSTRNIDKSLNFKFYGEQSSNCIDKDEEKSLTEGQQLCEVNCRVGQDGRWELSSDSSVLQLLQNYESSSQSTFSPQKIFQNIQVQQKKIKISDYLQQLRRTDLESLTTVEQNKNIEK